MSDLTQLDSLFRRWCSFQARAMTGQMAAAAHVMAERARAAVPSAAVLVLEDSDQGDWLTLTAVEDAAGNTVDTDALEDIDQGAASCIYQDVAATVAGITVRAADPRYPSVYALTIGQTSPPPLPVEVIVVRDPDAADDVRVLVGGEVVTEEVSVVCVDAGAGWDVADWQNARADALADASPAAASIIANAFGNAPGARYITGFEAGE